MDTLRTRCKEIHPNILLGFSCLIRCDLLLRFWFNLGCMLSQLLFSFLTLSLFLYNPLHSTFEIKQLFDLILLCLQNSPPNFLFWSQFVSQFPFYVRFKNIQCFLFVVVVFFPLVQCFRLLCCPSMSLCCHNLEFRVKLNGRETKGSETTITSCNLENILQKKGGC